MPRKRSTGENSARRPKMDYRTAIAFALEAFDQLHPKETRPEWLSRCTVVSCGQRHVDGQFVCSLTVTPLSTRATIVYFEAVVDKYTGAATVLIDRDPNEFDGRSLADYDPSIEY